MDFKKLSDWTNAHPILVALGFFVVAFLLYNVLKKGGTGSSSSTLTPTAQSPVAPGYSETYAQQYNSYPQFPNATANIPISSGQQTQTQTQTINNPPPPSTPIATTPPVYHGVLTVAGSRYPANIGPWIPGRHVTFQGVTYVLHPGPAGRLWGDVIGGAQGVLLWDGSDRNP